MLIKMDTETGASGFNVELHTRLENLAQKARDKAAALKTDTETPGATEQTAAAGPEELDFSKAQDRTAFLSSLHSAGEALGVQSDEILTQHTLDPERVAQLLDL